MAPNPNLVRWAVHALALATTLLAWGCDDELAQCFPTCPTNLVCATGADGLPACLQPCGVTVCTDAQTCQNNVCVGGGSVTCGAGEHAVGGVCVPNYTTANVCDPLRACRNACGTSAACLQACDADQSATCDACLTSLTACESRQNCDSGPYVETCCFDDFCECYPAHPNCGNVPPCDECNDECGASSSCLTACIEGEPACSNCLQPYFECTETGGANCAALAADCSSN